MRGLNRATLIGNLGSDPELTTLKDGTEVAKMAIATTEHYTLKGGDRQTRTDWHNIVAWRGLASLARQYLHKGSLIFVEGKMRSRSYEDAQGQKKYITEIVADQIIMLDKKKPSAGSTADAADEDFTAENLPF